MKDSDRIHPLLLEATLEVNKLPVDSPTPGLRKLLEALSSTALSYFRYCNAKESSSAPGPLSAIEDPDSLLRVPMSPEIYELFRVADVYLRGLSLSRDFLASGDFSEKNVRVFNESLRLILSSG